MTTTQTSTSTDSITIDSATAAAYCRRSVFRSRSSFFWPLLFLSKTRRRALFALYAFCREVDDIVDHSHGKSNDEKEADLSRWHREIQATFEGAPSHPIGVVLAKSHRLFQLPVSQFFEILNGVAMDLEKNRYKTLTDLTCYCEKVAVSVGRITLAVFGAHGPKAEQFAYHVGLAFQLTNILRDIPIDLTIGRIYLPTDLLTAFGVSEDQLFNRHWSPALGHLLNRLGEIAGNHYQQAMALLDNDPVLRSSVRSAILMTAIYHTYLKKLRAIRFRVFDHPPVRLNTLAKLWIIARTLPKTWAFRRVHLRGSDLI